MEITYDLRDLARKEILIGALNKLSPTDVIKLKVIDYLLITLLLAN